MQRRLLFLVVALLALATATPVVAAPAGEDARAGAEDQSRSSSRFSRSTTSTGLSLQFLIRSGLGGRLESNRPRRPSGLLRIAHQASRSRCPQLNRGVGR